MIGVVTPPFVGVYCPKPYTPPPPGEEMIIGALIRAWRYLVEIEVEMLRERVRREAGK